jgi:hypothetical protein
MMRARKASQRTEIDVLNMRVNAQVGLVLVVPPLQNMTLIGLVTTQHGKTVVVRR